MLNVVPITEHQEATFDDFWLIYPRREAKKAALKSWSRMTPVQQMDALVALVGWRKVFLGRESAQYIPLPSSWLNGERWEDELPSDFRPASYVDQQDAEFRARQAEAKGKNVPMPESVRLLIAKLKAQR